MGVEIYLGLEEDVDLAQSNSLQRLTSSFEAPHPYGKSV